ncbi:hypothetical protein GN958_ATG21606 [Phytophthora infestans]|uniref:Uncharacterized protein n=1 Tax=Phytophthora infestans TaxID=4787 RepID=A0A8S9TNT5_PHYIN|nr:hypothetical protein GN958_ATG21606 [Phytophthora infestans]
MVTGRSGWTGYCGCRNTSGIWGTATEKKINWTSIKMCRCYYKMMPSGSLVNEIVAEEQLTVNNVALTALRWLPSVHCPPGAWVAIVDQLMQLKKTRTVIVREYAHRYMYADRLATGDARTWDLSSLESQFEAIERNEKAAALMRGSRPAQR